MPEKKNLKPIPKFESENEEREFWATYDSIDYVDWSQANRDSFPNLKPSTRTSSLCPLGVVETPSENLDVLSLCGALKPSVRGVTLKDMEEVIRKGAAGE